MLFGEILNFVRVSLIDKHTILMTNRMLTVFIQPHENRYSSNRNSNQSPGLPKIHRVWRNSTVYGKIPSGLAKLNRVSPKSAGFGKNPTGFG